MTEKSHYTLVAPGIGNANSVVKIVIEEALISFFLGYSLPDEVYDDCWYYLNIREHFLDDDGYPTRAACDSGQEYWNYCRDPSVGIRELTEKVSGHLENIIELNERGINDLYDRRVFTAPFDVVFHGNAITMVFRG